MIFDEALLVWAAKKLEIEPENIKRVIILGEEGYSYSEYTFEYGSCEVIAELTDGKRRVILDLQSGGEWDFLALLNEILAATDE